MVPDLGNSRIKKRDINYIYLDLKRDIHLLLRRFLFKGGMFKVYVISYLKVPQARLTIISCEKVEYYMSSIIQCLISFTEMDRRKQEAKVCRSLSFVPLSTVTYSLTQDEVCKLKQRRTSEDTKYDSIWPPNKTNSSL